MGVFDTQKSLITVFNVLVFAILLSTSPAAHADDVPSTAPETATTYDFVFGEGDLDELRKLLSAPKLNDEERQILRRTLDTIREEIA